MDQKKTLKTYTKIFYWLGGIISLLVGILFLFFPILPTVPFLILAAYLLTKASSTVSKKLSKLPYIGKWFAHREKSVPDEENK